MATDWYQTRPGIFLDYLEWRGDLSFWSVPMNEVDALILAWLSFLPLDDIVPAKVGRTITVRGACRHVLQGVPEFHDSRDLEFCRRIAETRRFGELEFSGFRNNVDVEQQKQFAAVTIHMGEGDALVAFRGTDGTLVGWREDFNMTLRNSVPAQVSAANYLLEVAAAVPGRISLAGHSKGGNLSVYASVYAPGDVQDRIIDIYSFDGPGFHEDVFNHAGFARVRDRIHVLVPQTSVVGMMMGHEVPYTVVHSTESGLRQHDPYSWEVMGPEFVTLDRTTTSSRFVDQSLKDWMDGLTEQQQQAAIDTIFDVLQATGVEKANQLSDGWYRNAMTILSALRGVDKDTRSMVNKTLTALMRAARGNLRTFRESPPDPRAVGEGPGIGGSAEHKQAKKARKKARKAAKKAAKRHPRPEDPADAIVRDAG